MKKKTVLIIGSGAGGAMAARELQGDFQVTILECGKAFRPFPLSVPFLAKFRKTGLFFDERLIRMLLPNMMIQKSEDMVLVRGKGLGGTTPLATGNAIRYDRDLQAIGIDLTPEYEALEAELPITTVHRQDWTDGTEKMFQIFQELSLNPVVTPKLLRPEKCIGCGHCAIGCPTGAKWDTRELLKQAVEAGAELITGCTVEKLIIQSNQVTAVQAKQGGKTRIYQADMIISAAGGMGTPEILENSGIHCPETFFVDPVLCVAAPIQGYHQEHQLLMPFISQQDGYILSPYMDYLSFFFNRKWYQPMDGIVSIMIKQADEAVGSYMGKPVRKTLTLQDKAVLSGAVEQSRQILLAMGAKEEEIFLGTLNAGHPGGMFPPHRSRERHHAQPASPRESVHRRCHPHSQGHGQPADPDHHGIVQTDCSQDQGSWLSPTRHGARITKIPMRHSHPTINEGG